jgi:hypothetical protein
MGTIISLLPTERDAASEVERLVKTGIPKRKIQILTQDKAIRDIFGCDPICTIRNYAILGALLVGSIYMIFGIVATWCECNLMGFDHSFGLLTLFGGVLAGGFVGGVLGAIIGLGESEKETHLYIQKAHQGAKVILIKTTKEEADQTKIMLQHEGYMGIKTIQED